MIGLGLLFQLAAATPRDSTQLRVRVQDEGFQFVMRWRWQAQYDMRFPTVVEVNGVERVVRPTVKTGEVSQRVAVIRVLDTIGGWLPRSQGGPVELLGTGAGRCTWDRQGLGDADQRANPAHIIKGSRPELALCPVWNFSKPAAVDPAADRALTREASDSVRAMRRRYLRTLDSAARILPGDGWIAGQRVRFYLDQSDVTSATRAADECRAQAWWCAALSGYVRYQANDPKGAESAYLRAHAAMPPDVRCAWDDLAPLLAGAERDAYSALPCAARDSINRVGWWLADPLFAQSGNPRHVEQLVRQTMIALHGALDADLWQDWRQAYQGPQMREMVLRYGWPMWEPLNAYVWPGEAVERRAAADARTLAFDTTDTLGLPRVRAPLAFGRFDTKATFLGVNLNVTYAGPQFHTVPSLASMRDPFGIADTDWDLAAPRAPSETTPPAGARWDGWWWPTEFFRHPGAVVPAEYQIAFLRRGKQPALAAAMAWDTTAYPFPVARSDVQLSTTLMRGPDAPQLITTTTVAPGGALTVATFVDTGRTLLSLEMIPVGKPGTNARARFGIEPPAPLSALAPGDIALSDPILIRATASDRFPANLNEMLSRMLGTTTLRDPRTLGVFWEAYGLADRDTVDVTVRVIRHDDAGSLARLGARLGVGRVGDDSLAIRWREPRADDPAATRDGAITIRPRGLSFDVSALGSGRYEVEVSVTRGSTIARSRRSLTIVR